MVKPTDLNVKGKVILPIPSLLEAMAQKSITFKESDYKKSLYAVAFGRFIAELDSTLKVHKDSDGDWVGNVPALKNYVGYVEFTSFETYKIVKCDQYVNFTLGEGSKWSRPYDFAPYAHDSYPPFRRRAMYNLVGQMLFYHLEPDPSDPQSKDSLVGDLKVVQELSEIDLINRRTTNAFIRKFGLVLKNPNLQSTLDNSSSLIKSFSSN